MQRVQACSNTDIVIQPESSQVAMSNASPISNTSQSAQLLAAVTGIAFGATTYFTLLLIIHYNDHADADIFGVRMLIACLSSIIVFSSQQLLGTLQEKHIFAAFPSITARWFVVFMVVLLSAYVDKAAEQLSRAVMLIWLFVTPFSLTLTALLIRSLAVYYYSNPSRRRKAVLIWSNSACADLVESLRNTPLAAIDFVGFFDNRNESRPPSNLERLGDLRDAAAWIVDEETGRVNVDVVFIGLNTKEPPELAEIIAILEDSTASTYFVRNR